MLHDGSKLKVIFPCFRRAFFVDSDSQRPAQRITVSNMAAANWKWLHCAQFERQRLDFSIDLDRPDMYSGSCRSVNKHGWAIIAEVMKIDHVLVVY